MACGLAVCWLVFRATLLAATEDLGVAYASLDTCEEGRAQRSWKEWKKHKSCKLKMVYIIYKPSEAWEFGPGCFLEFVF